MEQRVLFLALVVAIPAALAGCVGNTEELTPLSLTHDIPPTGRIVEIKMWVETIRQEIYPGFTAELWAFCMEALPGSEDTVELRGGDPCSVPGPTLRVDQGDRVRVPHTVHWHGQLVPWESDGVPGASQDTVQQGESYTYDYIATRPGTLMYHCHVDTQHHVFMGLYGAIIVDPQDQGLEPEVDQDITLVLSHGEKAHMRVPGPNDDPHAMHRGPFGSGDPNKQNAPFKVDYDLFMINGKSFPNTVKDPLSLIKVAEGDRVRIRLLNIGFLEESMHLHGHDMLVTHKDGLPLQPEARFIADTLRIAPGERYDVYVEATNPGKWPFHTHFPQHVTNDNMYPGGMLTMLIYEGFENATFKSEPPGGLSGDAGGAKAGPPMPADFSASEGGSVTDVQFSQDHRLPVEDERAELVSATLTLTAGTPLDELTVALLDADGNELQSGTVNADAPTATLAIGSPPNTGDYTVQVTGRGLQASYTLDLLVRYPAAGGGGDDHGGHAGH